MHARGVIIHLERKFGGDGLEHGPRDGTGVVVEARGLGEMQDALGWCTVGGPHEKQEYRGAHILKVMPLFPASDCIHRCRRRTQMAEVPEHKHLLAQHFNA